MAGTGLAGSLRDAAPYLRTHRDRTFVVLIGAGLAGHARLNSLISDLLILRHICAIRFALAFDVACKPGPVDSREMAAIGSRCATIRDRIEQLLTAGAPGGIPAAAAGGSNLLSARRLGIIDGIDMQERGCHPKADAAARGTLDAGLVALLPPIGFAADGSRLLVSGIDAAMALAAAVAADKIIVLADREEIDSLGFRDLTTVQARERIGRRQDDAQTAGLLQAAVQAIEGGVDRVHFISDRTDGGLLLELLSPDGVAAMVSRDPFDSIRPARQEDLPAIVQLLAPGVESGALAERGIEEISDRIDRFVVLAHDSAILACAALELSGDQAELRSLAVRSDSMNQARGELLLRYCERRAQEAGARRLLAASTQARDWFVARGFVPADASELPLQGRGAADRPRNSAVLAKDLPVKA